MISTEQYLEKYGQSFEHSVNIGELLKTSIDEYGIENTLLSIEHIKIDNIFHSVFEYQFKPASFVDGFYSGNTTEYYTASRQMNIESIITNFGFSTTVIAYRYPQDYMQIHSRYNKYIYSVFKDLQLYQEIDSLYHSYAKVVEHYSNFIDLYGVCSFTIVLIEKLLRLIDTMHSDKQIEQNLHDLSSAMLTFDNQLS